MGAELSIYEVNHHITAGNASDAAKNKIVTSIGAGLNVINSMLVWMKENHTRNQCFFTLEGNFYQIRLWGGLLGMKKGAERFRPTWLALETANKAIDGDLVETRHSAGEPTFVPLHWDNRTRQFEELEPLPVIWSYAFADGQKRGLILLNIDTKTPHEVELKLSGTIDGPAKSWAMTAPSIVANNELDNEKAPQVKVVEKELAGFASGHGMELPPFSLHVLSWKVQ